MSANVDLEKVAALIGESIDFVRVNLQEGTLLIDGEPIGYAVKKKETQKNFFYVVDPIRFVKYVKELKKSLVELEEMEIKWIYNKKIREKIIWK